MCWGEAPVGCLPCSYHDLIRQNLQVHSRDDPRNINTTSLTPLAFTVPPSLLPPDLGSSSHPYFHILLGYSFLSSPFPPHLAFSLFSSVFSIVPFTSPPLLRSLSRDPSFILPSLLSGSLISLSHLRLTFWDLEGWILQGLMPLWIYPLWSLFQQLSSASHPSPHYTSHAWSNLALCDPNMLFLWGGSDERGNQNPYRKSKPYWFIAVGNTFRPDCQGPTLFRVPYFSGFWLIYA